MPSVPVVQSPSESSKLPTLPTESFLSTVTLLAALCCCHRNEIRKVKDKPRKFACLKGLKKIDPELKSKWRLTDYTKGDFKSACKFRKSSISERPARVVGEVNLHEYVAPLLNLSRESQFNGCRILHLSDIHLQFKDRRSLNQLVAIARELPKLNIDFLAITGDLVDGKKSDLGDEGLAALRLLRHNVPRAFFVAGNHDYDAGIDHVIETVKRAKIEVLINQHVILEKGSDRLEIIGLDDVYHQIRKDAHFFKKGNISVNSLVEDHPTVVLAHSIDSLSDADYPALDLVFSGHTHGLMLKGLPFRKEYLKFHPGEKLLYDHNNQHSGWKALTPRTLSFVSNGFTDAHRRGIKKGHPFIQASEATIIELRSYQEFFEERQ